MSKIAIQPFELSEKCYICKKLIQKGEYIDECENEYLGKICLGHSNCITKAIQENKIIEGDKIKRIML